MVFFFFCFFFVFLFLLGGGGGGGGGLMFNLTFTPQKIYFFSTLNMNILLLPRFN